MEKILLVGVGNVGSHILEFVARDETNLFIFNITIFVQIL